MAAPTTLPFVMHGARDAIACGFTHIEEQVKSIEQAVVENPNFAFDLARTLIESTCRTVLKERKVSYNQTDDLPKLFNTVSQNLPFLPSTASGAVEARKSLEKTLSGMSTTIQGICELRNQYGFASHGADSLRPAMEGVQALLAAETADTIVGFLYRVHQQDRTPPVESMGDNTAFDKYVDEAYGPVRIFEAEFSASEVLLQMESETYRIYLTEFQDNDVEAMSVAKEGTQP